MQYPYTLQGAGEEIRQPLVDNWLLVSSCQNYERPDGSPFKKLTPLYQEKTVEEERSTGQELRVCKREWDIISQWQRKTRHEIHYIMPINIYSITWRRGVDEQNTVKISEVLSRQIQKSTRIQEEPNCGAIKG